MTRLHLPGEVQEIVLDELGDLDRHRRDLFTARLRRWWPDLVDGLATVHPGRDLLLRLVRRAAVAFRERDDDLHALDLERTLDPGWFQHQSMIGYACYTERFAGNIAGVGDRIGYLRDLGVTYLHLMPLLKPRPGDSDGGYAVADYRTVRPDLGTMDDLRDLAGRLRGSGISLVLDLVLNHVAREHEWAVRARAGEQRYRDYFYCFPDRSEPDRYEETLPEVFPDFAPGSFTWDDDLAGWVWTTFNSWQWDLNWSNPDVFFEFVDLVLHLANQGVEVFRLDAIAFIWKRMGTSCQNQPEVHAITQALRALARIACPAVLFKAEAIVGPRELVSYLGTGRHHGKVSDLAYHNSLMVQVWSMLASQDVRLAAQALGTLPARPSSSAWITYVRCHDDIGWAVDDEDAAAVGLAGFAHRAFLSDWYTGSFPGSPARGLVFQANPATGDRRVSGTAASLAGVELLGEGDRSGGWAAVSRVLLAHAVVYGWGGIPVLWSGDELGQTNDVGWADDPGHAGDNRWVHRPRLDPAALADRDVEGTVAHAIFLGLKHLAEVRSGLVQLSSQAPTVVLPVDDAGVLALLRPHPVGPLLELINVTWTWRPFPGHRLRELGLDHGVDALTGSVVTPQSDDALWVPPLTAMWVTGVGGHEG
jgi:amylosucrase